MSEEHDNNNDSKNVSPMQEYRNNVVQDVSGNIVERVEGAEIAKKNTLSVYHQKKKKKKKKDR